MEEKIYTSELAGHCNASTAWQILKEVSESLIDKGLRSINPCCIEISDDGRFLVTAEGSDFQDTFNAPENADGQLNEAGTVWSLGATVFYIVMGCQVMNGKGGKGQRENSRLPYMRSEWPKLSELIQQCLNFKPNKRPSLQEIRDKASEQHKFFVELIQRGPKIKTINQTTSSKTEPDQEDLAFWPDKM